MPQAKQPLTGRTALVTGGATRVGAAIGRTLHAAGAHLVIHYRRSSAHAEELQAELEAERPGSVSLLQADLLDTAGLPALIDAVVAAGYAAATIIGGTGGRMAHTLANALLLTRERRIELDWVTSHARISALFDQGADVHVALPDYREIFAAHTAPVLKNEFRRIRNKMPDERIHLAEDRAFDELERPAAVSAGFQHLRAEDVGGHQVRRELDALEGQPECLRERPDQQGLRGAGHARNQAVAADEQGHKQ